MEEDKSTDEPQASPAPGVPTGSQQTPSASEPNLPSQKRKSFGVGAPSRWFMGAILVANIMFVVAPTLIYLHLIYLAKQGVSGTEFIAFPLIFVFPLFVVTLFANIVCIPWYLIKSEPSTVYAVLAYLALAITLIMGGMSVYFLISGNDHSSSSTTYAVNTPSVNPSLEELFVKYA